MEIKFNWIVELAFSCTSWLALGVSFYSLDPGKNFVYGMTLIRQRD